MVCQVDNKNTFATEEPYTQKCEACSLYVKVYKLRSCEDRFKWCDENGIDLFKEFRELDKIAKFQSGEAAVLPKTSLAKQNSTPKKPTRRGR